MTVQYAIPSRGRAATLTSKTLPLLGRLGVDPRDVTVFVAPDEVEEYAAAVVATDYRAGVAEGALGMSANHNRIVDAYPEGSRVIRIDDDLRDLVVRRSDKLLEPIPADEWSDVVRLGFETTDRLGARLWGLYAATNPMFMKPRIRTSGLWYIAGGLFGMTITADRDPLRVSLEDKEDFERSLRCYVADGAVVRFDYVSWRTSGYHGAGGMQTDGLRTKERVLAATMELVRRYPGLVTPNLKKKSGWAEPRLRDSRPQREEIQ